MLSRTTPRPEVALTPRFIETVGVGPFSRLNLEPSPYPSGENSGGVSEANDGAEPQEERRVNTDFYRRGID